MNDSILSPSADDRHSDQFVTISSLPADELEFAREAYGWDVEPSPEELLADERRNDAAALRFSPCVGTAPRGRFEASVRDSDNRLYKAGRHKTEREAWLAAELLASELAEAARADAARVA
jgi:hypothetical protein